MTIRIDGFEHALFVPDEARDLVGARLDALFTEAAAYLGRSCPDAVLVVAGSIARGEAAVLHRPGGWELSSDVDFVALLPEHTNGDKVSTGLVAHLATHTPEVLATCFTVQGADVSGVRSHFGADLWLGSVRPLAGELDAVRLPRPATGPTDDLELIVHQLANYLLLPSGPGRDSVDHRLRKLLLESLRALTPPGHDGITRFRDILGADTLAGWRGILHARQVRTLLTGRELGLPLGMDHHTAATAARSLIGRFLLPGADPDEAAAGAELERLTARRSDVLGLFQIALIAYFGLLEAKDPRRYAPVLLAAWRQLDTERLDDAAPHQEAVASLKGHDLVVRRPAAMTVLREAMAALRRDYYRDLGPRNFGHRAAVTEIPALPLVRAERSAPGGGNLTGWPQWAGQLPLADVTMEGAVGRIAGGGQGSCVLWAFPEGGGVPAHRHGPQIGLVVSGAVHLMRDGLPDRIVRAGESFEIGDGQAHSATVEPDTLVIEVFWEAGRHQPVLVRR